MRLGVLALCLLLLLLLLAVPAPSTADPAPHKAGQGAGAASDATSPLERFPVLTARGRNARFNDRTLLRIKLIPKTGSTFAMAVVNQVMPKKFPGTSISAYGVVQDTTFMVGFPAFSQCLPAAARSPQSL